MRETRSSEGGQTWLAQNPHLAPHAPTVQASNLSECPFLAHLTTVREPVFPKSRTMSSPDSIGLSLILALKCQVVKRWYGN